MVSAGSLPPARNSHGIPFSSHHRFFAVIHSRDLWWVRYSVTCSALKGVYTQEPLGIIGSNIGHFQGMGPSPQ